MVKNRVLITISFFVVLISFVFLVFHFFSDLTSPQYATQSGDFFVTVKENGRFEVVAKKTGWSFAGKINSVLSAVSVENNSDRLGDYSQIVFNFNAPTSDKEISGYIKRNQSCCLIRCISVHHQTQTFSLHFFHILTQHIT